MTINKQLIDQIVFDSELEGGNLASFLHELQEVPETWVNSVCEKSYDEMTLKEKKKAIKMITEYLEENYEA